MWFINQRAVELWSSLLQVAAAARNTQGLIKELGKLPPKNPSGAIRPKDTLPQKDSIQRFSKALKCPMEILYIFFLVFSFSLCI